MVRLAHLASTEDARGKQRLLSAEAARAGNLHIDNRRSDQMKVATSVHLRLVGLVQPDVWQTYPTGAAVGAGPQRWRAWRPSSMGRFRARFCRCAHVPSQAHIEPLD